MSDTNKNENNQGNNNSLFLYTSLIFIAAIIIILFAYFTQTKVERAQPSPIPETEAAPYDPDAAGPSIPPETEGGPQGIAKTAAQLSQDNLELLEENRELHNRLDELEEKQSVYEPLIEAYYAKENGNTERAKLLLESIDYTTVTDEEKLLYDTIKSDLQ